jgi:hypothetical protein
VSRECKINALTEPGGKTIAGDARLSMVLRFGYYRVYDQAYSVER